MAPQKKGDNPAAISKEQIGRKVKELSKSKSKLSNKEVILEMNSPNKYDRVLIRQAMESYSKQSQLDSPADPQEIESFFEYVQSSIEQIESDYLMTSSSSKYLQNKIRVEKFIKDEEEHYQAAVEKYLKPVSEEEDQRAINSSEINSFFSTLFTESDHIKVLKNGVEYFGEDPQQKSKAEKETEQVVTNYAISTKEISKDAFTFENFYLEEEEVLELLTFWLKFPFNEASLEVVYARTPRKMKSLVEEYKGRVALEQQNDDPANEFIDKDELNEFEQKQKARKSKQKGLVPSELRQSTLNSGEVASRAEQFQKMLPELFLFGCKRRTIIHKYTTFDDIKAQSRTMSLEKFINLCTYLELQDVVTRDYLIDMFKLYAINRLHLDEGKFAQLATKVSEGSPGVIDKCLSANKGSFIHKKKMKNIQSSSRKSMEKSMVTQQQESSLAASSSQSIDNLAGYAYKLRPVNGMDVESIQHELEQRKQQKLQQKKMHDEYMLKKKNGYFNKYKDGILQLKPKQSRNASNSNSSFLIGSKDELSLRRVGMQQFPNRQSKNRQNSERFNPQSLISNAEDEDALWKEYEAKIWKRDNTRNQFNENFVDSFDNPIMNETQNTIDKTLRGNGTVLGNKALSKRLERGNNVLKKIESSKLKYYV